MCKFFHFLLLIVLFVGEGCKTRSVVAGFEGDDRVRKIAKQSYALARESMLEEGEVALDVLWGLDQFASNDSQLSAFVVRSKGLITKPRYMPGVFPEVPRHALPDRPGEGIRRFITYLEAALGGPEDQAAAYIEAFVAGEYDGYVLTHQFLSLVWAEQAGLSISPAMKERRSQLWERIYGEQCEEGMAGSFDLCVERLAIILFYGKRQQLDRSIVDGWVSDAIRLQGADGAWALSKTRIYYDGASTVLFSPRSHTTVLAMWALHSYLNVKW